MIGPEAKVSLKNPVTQPGIDPGTVRLVAQRLKHYATPGFGKRSALKNVSTKADQNNLKFTLLHEWQLCGY